MSRHKTLAFRQEFIGAIRRGEKTQTRRPVRRSKLRDGSRVVRPCSYVPGDLCELVLVDDERVAWADLTLLEQASYRGGPFEYVYRRKETPTGWFLRIGSSRREAMIDISDADLAAEGFADDREGFLEWMGAQYGEHVESVWVIEFERELDVPWMPARQHGYLHPEQYTLSASEAIDRDLGESVDSVTLASFAEHNRTKDTLRRLEATAAELSDTTSLEEQLAAVRRLARQRGISIRSTERLIQRKIDEIKAQLRKAA